jgi:hypothetical protein
MCPEHVLDGVLLGAADIASDINSHQQHLTKYMFAEAAEQAA